MAVEGSNSGIKIDKIHAGNDVHLDVKLVVPPRTDEYMIVRGHDAHRAFLERPGEPWGDPVRGPVEVSALRARFVDSQIKLEQPVLMTVTGTFLPCALLSSGWWEKHGRASVKQDNWRNEVQAWLFHGFELWGPSWDFTFDLEHWNDTNARPYFIGQLGEGDEANSIPVLLPKEKARRILDYVSDRPKGSGGFEAEITGLLGHRHHFAKTSGAQPLELFGGLFDYCLWIDESNPTHRFVARASAATGVYSGYLWKCVAPKTFLPANGLPTLRDVFFVWEHTNFASASAVAFNLEALATKERFLTREFGELALVQKSSDLVPGEPLWSSNEVYSSLIGKRSVAL